jgi:hypothetical protein
MCTGGSTKNAGCTVKDLGYVKIGCRVEKCWCDGAHVKFGHHAKKCWCVGVRAKFWNRAKK